MQFIRFKNFGDYEDGIYNADLIKQLSCDNDSCSGLVLSNRRVHFKETSATFPTPQTFKVDKSTELEMYSNLRSLYNKSSLIDNDPSKKDTTVLVLAGVLCAGIGFAGANIVNRR